MGLIGNKAFRVGSGGSIQPSTRFRATTLRSSSSPVPCGCSSASPSVRRGRERQQLDTVTTKLRWFRNQFAKRPLCADCGYAEQTKARQTRAAEAPKELQDLIARIARLRERLRKGDPEMVPDELLAAIDRAEGKELESEQSEAKASAKLLSILPKAAALYREQIARGLDGNPGAAAKSHVVLKEMFGKIALRREGQMLFAEYTLRPEALLQAVGLKGVGSSHIEVRICHSSGKNFSSSALARYDTPAVPPVPAL